MGQEQKDGAKRASEDWERLWRIFTFPNRASAADIAWATDFFKHNIENMRGIASMETDPDEIALLELVYLGLFHRGYTLPLEFKFLRTIQN